MKAAASAEHRSVHSHHHQHGRHAAAPPGELKRLAFWATLQFLAGCAVGSTRRAEVSQTHPAPVELLDKALAARRQPELVTARAPG